MSFNTITQLQLDIKVTNAKCCASKLAYDYLQYLEEGDVLADEKMHILYTLDYLIFSLEGHNINDTDCLSLEDICGILEKIDNICSDCC